MGSHQQVPSSLAQDQQFVMTAAIKTKLFVGGGPSGIVAAADFDGASFNIVANDTAPGTSASWMVFKEPNLLYAVEENSNDTRLFNFDHATNDLKLVQNAAGSSGVVSLEFNQDKTVLVGAAFGQGQVDVWDVSAPDGTLKLLKQIPVGGTPGPVAGRQDSPHPHQALLDPSGRFFVVNDLGTDSVLVLDSQNDFNISNRVTVEAGTGPRHGAFIPSGAEKATHYFLACEITSVVKAFELTYTGDNLEFKEVQSLSSFGADFPPANATAAAAGELVTSSCGKHLYVSNRLTGNTTDSISHFSIDTSNAAAPLAFVDQISSGGLIPRMFSLAADESVLFSTNQDGENGLLALARDASTGSLTEAPVASLALDKFGGPSFGPQFVMELGAKGSNS
ncbi:Lactonase, 7-bladed beta-propeller-domain-containing protein [Diaporthe sp. PMI_573]|nr:Lactonase, 7-bladed beta-propeller-domain-containing protein [Diaporthaceae sp. PMI_573]